MTDRVNIHLPDLFDAQREVYFDRSRFRILSTGRRWGKTALATTEALTAALNGGRVWWVAPSFPLASIGWRALLEFAVQIPFAEIRRTDKRIEFEGAGFIAIKSADNPDSLRGEGLDLVIADECAFIPKDSWEFALRPTLSDREGRALLISTPKGRNWFYDLWTRGNDEQEPDFSSFNYASNTSPYFPTDELDEVRRTMPDAVFRQEYLAEFLDDTAGVFVGVDEIIKPTVGKPGRVVIGCDLAKHQDFTVNIALDEKTGQGVGFERFNKLDWPVQKQRIADFAKQHKGPILIDATGVGDPIFDDLRRAGVNVKPYKLSNQSKAALIQALIVAVEQGQVSIPPEWDVVADELKRYEYTYSKTGTISYNAPSGFHDDCVIALALAHWQRRPGNRPIMAFSDV